MVIEVCVEGWYVGVLKVAGCVVLKGGVLGCWRLCWRLVCWRLLKVMLCWHWCVSVFKVVLCWRLVCSCVESCVVFRLVCWYVEGCVEDWCVGVLKARSPQWLQQGRWECKARLRWRTGVKWGRRGVMIWLNICKDHPDHRVDSRRRLARRKAEDKALQVKMTLAWIRMVAVIGRRDVRFFFLFGHAMQPVGS